MICACFAGTVFTCFFSSGVGGRVFGIGGGSFDCNRTQAAQIHNTALADKIAEPDENPPRSSLTCSIGAIMQSSCRRLFMCCPTGAIHDLTAPISIWRSWTNSRFLPPPEEAHFHFSHLRRDITGSLPRTRFGDRVCPPLQYCLPRLPLRYSGRTGSQRLSHSGAKLRAPRSWSSSRS